ncbi:hypothetical protein [Sulfuricurvum sp.]|nr:hypothetical protein [Sulfuricurvum sp.]
MPYPKDMASFMGLYGHLSLMLSGYERKVGNISYKKIQHAL